MMEHHNTNQESIIPLSKTKIVLLTLGSLTFVLASVWMWTLGGTEITMDTLFYKIVSLSGILFFGMTGIYGLTKLFDNKPGLIINQQGLIDNSSAVSGKLIKWSDIEGFEISQIQSTKFILIFVRNPQHYMDQASYLGRFWMKMNYKTYGTPLSISSNSLKCNFDELVVLIEKHLAEFHP